MSRILSRLAIAVLLSVEPAHARQSFYNLGFESAQNLPPDFSTFSTSDALPGWLAYSGTNQLDSIFYYNDAFLVPVQILSGDAVTLVGRFSVQMSSNGYTDYTNRYGPGSITQNGLVPSDARSVLFAASGACLELSLGGQVLPYIAISNTANYTIFGTEVSAFAGQTATLAFVCVSGIKTLDDIRFSPEYVPEPSTPTLLGLGGGYLLTVLRRTGRRRSLGKSC